MLGLIQTQILMKFIQKLDMLVMQQKILIVVLEKLNFMVINTLTPMLHH